MKKYLKQITRVSLLLAILGSSTAFADSPVWGTYKVECPANSETYIGITTTRAPVFTGKVQSVQSGTTNIVAQGEPNWSVNQFVYVVGSQTNHYYLKFTSGELEGAWYDIKSNSSSDVEIEIGSAELAKIAVDDTFQIIPHWTMATLFPNGGGFARAESKRSSLNRTVLWKKTKYGENGLEYPKGENGAALAKYYYRKYEKIDSWLDINGNDASNVVVEPNTYFKAVQPATITSTVCYSAVVPMCATSFELFTLEDEAGKGAAQHIYISVPSAVDMKMSDLTEALIDSGYFSTSKNSRRADIIYVYNNEKVGSSLPPDQTISYRKNDSVSYWEDVNHENGDNYVLKAGSALKILKKATATPVTYRCKVKPSYLK